MSVTSSSVSVQMKAKLAGILYLIVIVTAGFAEGFVRNQLVVDGNATATANNLLLHESLFRAGGVADIINVVCDTFLALLFYDLLKPVSRSLALLTAFFRLMHVAVLAVSTLYHFAALLVVRMAQGTGAPATSQPSPLMLICLKLHGLGYLLCLVFFGIACMVMGALITKSTFLPRLLGLLLALVGCCYVFNSFANFLAPEFASYLFPWLLLPGLPVELGLALWLVVKGVDAVKWEAAHHLPAHRQP